MVNQNLNTSHRKKLDEVCPICKKGDAYLHLIHIEGASWTSLQDTMKACLSCFTQIWAGSQ